jgi:hypothetical protein
MSETPDLWMLDEFDYRSTTTYTQKYDELKLSMRQWIINVTLVSYGAIGRRYLMECSECGEPAHLECPKCESTNLRTRYSADMIDAVIKDLTGEGVVNYDAYKPAPQMIKLKTAMPEKRREPETLGFNNQPREKFNAMIETRKKHVKKTKQAKQVERLFEEAA